MCQNFLKSVYTYIVIIILLKLICHYGHINLLFDKEVTLMSYGNIEMIQTHYNSEKRACQEKRRPFRILNVTKDL